MAIRSSTRLVFTATSVSVAVIATGAFSTAKAAQFDFSYTGTGINASGVIATDATGTLITGITGQRNGVSITSVAAPNTLAGNDNVFNPTGNPAFLTFSGVSFNLARDPTPVNFFFDTQNSNYAETSNNVNNSAFFVPVSANFTTVPESPSIFGLATFAVFGISAALRHKKSLIEQGE